MAKDDISNKSLATLLVVAIVVSIGSTWLVLNKAPGLLTITGLQSSTDIGTVDLEIETVGSIRFAVNNVTFGRGKVNTTAGNDRCILDTNGTNQSSKCINFTAVTSPFQLENDGSQNASVQLFFSNDADGFIGGDSSINDYRYVVDQNETDSCRNNSGGTGEPSASCALSADNIECSVGPTGWAAVNASGGPGNIICQVLLPDNLADSITVGVNISIPFNSPAEVKISTLTATATSVP